MCLLLYLIPYPQHFPYISLLNKCLCVTLLLLQEQALRFGQTFLHNKTSLSQADPRLNFESDVNLLPCMGMKEIHSQPFFDTGTFSFRMQVASQQKERKRMLLMH